MLRKLIVFAMISAALYFMPLTLKAAGSADAGAAQAAAVTQTAYPSPTATPHYTQAIGIDVGLANRAIPGISYTRLLTRESRISLFAGGIYTNGGAVGLTELNIYYNLNEFFYAGIGVNAALDENNTYVIGFFNPTVGLKSDIISDYKLFIEGTLVFFSYQSQPDAAASLSAAAPFIIYKMGIKYFY